jgi:hypothetical protein
LAVGTLLAALAASPGAWAQDYERAPVVDPSSILPAEALQGPEHRVYGKANGEGMLYTYNLWTPFGTYTPGSTDMLMTRIQEARAMAQLRNMMNDPLFLQGMESAVAGTAQAVGSAIERPFKTLAGIPMGVGKFLKQTGDRIEEGQVTGETAGPLLQKAKNKLAVQLGVDPYSRNQELQKMMETVARSKQLGQLTASIGVGFIGAGSTIIITRSVVFSTKALNRLATMTGPELQQESRKILRDMGCDPGAVSQFLDMDQYSVSRRIGIASSMEALRGCEGVKYYVSRILKVPSLEVALYYQRQIEMAEAYNTRVERLVRVGYADGMPVWTDGADRLVILAPVDTLYWNAEVEARMKALKKSAGTKGVQIWITGTATERAKKMVSEAGMTLHEKVSERLFSK